MHNFWVMRSVFSVVSMAYHIQLSRIQHPVWCSAKRILCDIELQGEPVSVASWDGSASGAHGDGVLSSQ